MGRQHDSRQPHALAVVEQLEQLLLRPGRWVGGIQVVEDEERGAAYLLEQLRERHPRVFAVGRAQMVQEVGGHEVQRRQSAIDAVVGHGGAHVGLAGNVAAPDDEPGGRSLAARQVFAPGEGTGDRECVVQPARFGFGWRQPLEVDLAQAAQVAIALEALQFVRLGPLTRALAGHDLPKLWMPHLALQSHETGVVAQRAVRRFDLDRRTQVSVG